VFSVFRRARHGQRMWRAVAVARWAPAPCSCPERWSSCRPGWSAGARPAHPATSGSTPATRRDHTPW